MSECHCITNTKWPKHFSRNVSQNSCVRFPIIKDILFKMGYLDTFWLCIVNMMDNWVNLRTRTIYPLTMTFETSWLIHCK